LSAQAREAYFHQIDAFFVVGRKDFVIEAMLAISFTFSLRPRAVEYADLARANCANSFNVNAPSTTSGTYTEIKGDTY
jgi:hypothetical protein